MAVEEVPATQFQLHAEVMAALEDEIGTPREIADAIVERIPDEALREVVRLTLPPYIHATAARTRGHQLRAPRDDTPRSSRWDEARAVAWEVELLRARVSPRGVPKLLGTCDAKDCIDLASSAALQVEQLQRREREYKACAAVMQRRGFATVADIPRDLLKKIFNA